MRVLEAVLLSCLAATSGRAEGEPKTLPIERARLLPVSSDTATQVVAAVLDEFGFRLRVDQPQDGLFVTRVTSITRVVPTVEVASLATVGFWRYRPARNGGCPVDMPMTVAIDFKNQR